VSNTPIASPKIVVKDSVTGNPVPNATVTSDLGLILGTTNAQGELTVLVEPDEYVLSATADGYLRGTPVAFTINAGETPEVVVPALPTGPNLARAAKASASTEDENGPYPASLANDGDLSTYWLAVETFDQHIALTWAQPTTFNVVQLRGFRGVIGRSYLQVLGDDGKTWVDVPNTVISPETLGQGASGNVEFRLPNITTTGVRYFITTTNSATSIPGLSEFIVHNAPLSNP
jgi:hypothetical protein